MNQSIASFRSAHMRSALRLFSGLLATVLLYWTSFGQAGQPAPVPAQALGNTYEITATAGPNGSINPSGVVIVTEGEMITFTITPDFNYEIEDVEVDGISQGPIEDYTFYGVSSDATIHATFKPLSFEIYAYTDGGGTIDPSGSVYVPLGESQTFTITPYPGFMLYDVMVDQNSVGPVTEYTFTNVSDGHSIYAQFLQIQYIITPTSGPGGYIDPSSEQYHFYGDSRTFTIHPDPGYRILDVLVDGVSVGPVTEYTFDNISADHTIEATFELLEFTIDASATGNGFINPSGSVAVWYGDQIQFDFFPDPGHEIKAVLVDGNPVPIAPFYEFGFVTSNHTLEVQFGPVDYTIVASAGSGGSISPSGNVIAQYGTDQQFTITPDPGYLIEAVLVNGIPAGPISSYTFNYVTGNNTIHATFSRIQYSIDASAGTNGTISPSGIVMVNHGDSQTFTITPDQGYVVEEVEVDGIPVGPVTSYTFTNVTANHDIWATFVQSTVTTVEITVRTSSPLLAFTVDNVQYLNSRTFHWVPGSTHTIATTSPQTIDAGTQAVFMNWSDGGDLSHSITAPSTNTTYTATFKTQYLLQTFEETAGGTISPPTGFYDAGNVEISATANSGYLFSGFSGALTGTTTPQTLNLTGPASVGASFTPFNSFTFLDAGIPMIQEGMSIWGDYDNDGYLDVFVTGHDGQNTKISKVYRNNGNGTFSDIGAGLVGVGMSSAAWGDIDNDGDLDLVVVGMQSNNVPISLIYRNDNGTFTNINVVLPGVHHGTVAFGDYNNDGFLDLLLGGNSTEPITKLYKNNKNGTFSEVYSGLPALGVSAAAWGDFDNDGDLDILITGMEGQNVVSRVYRNTGGIFTDIQAGLVQGFGRSAVWGDYNNDGYLDILMSVGDFSNNRFTKVYRNTGPGQGWAFEDINASLPGLSSGSVAWGDFDNDGDLDILLTGFAGNPVTQLYVNNAGSFELFDATLFGSGDGHVAWGDFDNDGDLDILRAGMLFVNSSLTVNTAPTAPAILSAVPVGNNRVALEWSAATDGQTPANGLSYNLRVGTTPGASNILGPMANTANGFRRIPARGPQQTLKDTLALPPGTYYWSVQAVDAALAGGPFASEGNFTIAPSFTEVVTLPGLLESAAAWGDYDNDGDLDYVVTGTVGPGEYYTRIYRNDGQNVFTLINANLVSVYGGSVAWGDYDNDGDLDLVVMGYVPGQLATKLYRNDGNDTFTEVNAGLSGGGSGSVAWGDVDGDGDLDLLIMANRYQNRVTNLYRNDGNNTFTLINTGLPPLMMGTVAWGDYDNDGDLDLLVVGANFSYGNAITRVYRNDGITQNSLQLTDINAGLPPVIVGAAAWGDYDNDGYLDIALTGSLNDDYTVNISRVYRNNGNGTFTNINAGLTPVRSGSIAWGDFDNDGDLDILLSGGTTAGFPGNPVTKVFENRNGTFHDIEAGLREFQNGIAAWGDYDNDGDLDILLVGGPGTGGSGSNAIFRNNITTPNTVPSAPTGLTATPLSNNRIALAWNAAIDGQTPVAGLSYNLRVGTTPGASNILGPMANTTNGYRRIPARGPQQILRDTLTLPQGQYYWSVQAIDGALAGGPFASEMAFNSQQPVEVTVTTSPTGLGIRVDDVDYTSPQTFQWVPNSSHTIATTSPQSLVTGTQYVFENWSDGGALSHTVSTPSSAATYTATFKTQHYLTTSAGTGGTISPASGFYDAGDVQVSATASSGYLFSGFSGALTGTATPQTLNLTGPASVSASFILTPFTEINPGLTGAYFSSNAWGDYDNDGDLDILITGDDGFTRISKVYRNDGGGTFTDINAGLPGVDEGSVAWGDYDNDGDLDILLTGSGISRVYRNDDGAFTDINAGLTGVLSSSVAWGDYDNDGNRDILLTGLDAQHEPVSKVYRNNGNGTFTSINAGLTDVAFSSVAWGDYDNDGDLDILLTGQDGTSNIFSSVYRNDGNGTFTNINAGLWGVRHGSVAWGDYDNDGDLDILLAGRDVQNNPISKVYRNDNGAFTDINAGIMGVNYGSVAWGDYDNDGKLDILITGESGTDRISRVYRNEGGGVFIDISAGLTGAAFGATASWADYDNDGDLDILLNGLDIGYSEISKLYRNNTTTSNTVPTAPTGLTATPLSNNRIALAWNAATDGQTPAAGLSYNLRVGTTPGASNILGPMANTTNGYRRIPARGPQQILRDTLTLPPGQYYWSVQAIDGAFAGGPFATEASFDPRLFVDINAGLAALSRSTVGWGDYDNDGDLDALVSGFTGGSWMSVLARNDGGGIFTPVNAGLEGGDNSSIAWGDYDNDGWLDVLMRFSNPTPPYLHTKLYRNNSGIFTEINAGLPGVDHGSVAWGDYDNDGDLDILLQGTTDGYASGAIAKVYRNNGSGSFTDINAGLTPLFNGTVAWGDYDNDGNLDILQTGSTGFSEQRFTKVYRNNGDGTFTDINAAAAGVNLGAAAWGDFNNDGYLDFIVAGYPQSEGKTTKLYRNDPGVGAARTFTEITTSIPPLEGASFDWGDYDNDGDLDILFSGRLDENGFSLPYTVVFRNDGSAGPTAWTFTAENPRIEISRGEARWGDYDNDGRLDILVAGDNRGTPQTLILRNNGTFNGNTAPTAPTGLTATPLSNNRIALAWSAATDGQTPAAGLSYNLRVGTTAGASNILGPMANTTNGYRRIPARGSQQILRDTLTLPPGQYYWSVQAIDGALAGGPFASEGSFNTAPFTDINAGLPGVRFSSVAWGDYDNDGDLDLLLMGALDASASSFITRVYRNDGGGTFTDINAGLTSMYQGSVAWGDYDNDGDLDILITGIVDISTPVTKIYRNDNGTFTDINAGLVGTRSGSVAWGDYDNDGDLDFVLAGNFFLGNTIIYRNDNGTFTDINAGLEGVVYPAVAWGDYDNDGDLDLLLTGTTNFLSSGAISRVYRNDGGGVFTDINAGLTGFAFGSAAWGDYDNDGDLDILLTGSINGRIYRNDGGGIFTEIYAGLPAAGSVAWGDYDNDGDLDILLTGSSSSSVSRIYRNDGGGIFTEINAGLADVSASAAAWGDFDNDGKLDILLTGNGFTAGSVARIYRNTTTAPPNTVPTAPTGLTATPLSNNRIALAWNAATDGQTPAAGLSYNLRVGTTAGASNILGPMANTTNGYRRIPARGPQQILRDTLTLPPGQYYWGVQAIDGALAGGPFASEGSFNTAPFTDINAGLPALDRGSVAWGDYDNDGDLDVLLTGYDGSTTVSKVFRNDNGTFTDINAGLTPVWLSSAVWGDYDNDGDLDILLTGLGPENIAISKVYRNNGDGTFVEVSAALTGIRNSSAAWGDFDNDGDLDILISGLRLSPFEPVSKLYRNDGPSATGWTFTEINAGLPAVYHGSIAWGDFDNDGDLDILLAGRSGTGGGDPPLTYILRNDGPAPNGWTFMDINAGLPGVQQSSVAWGDFDNDGDLDFLLAGRDASNTNISKLYRNDGSSPGSWTFTDIGAGLQGVIYASVSWGDYDNDGDLDILLTGDVQFLDPISKVYRNNGAVNGWTFTEINAGLEGIYEGSAAWGDFDNDGDLDIVIFGMNHADEKISKIYRNNIASPNSVPTAPSGLTATAIGSNRVVFEWNGASDNQTPSNGLSYNLRVGTTPGGVNVVSPMAKVGGPFTSPGQQDGWRRLPKLGPKQTLRDTLKLSGPGPFYWSVQAIDGALAGGPFAAEQSITPDPSGIVSDDFNTTTLKPFWTFINPGNPSALSLIGTGTPDALLRIAVPAGASHDIWTAGNMAPRIMQNANNVDFEVEVKFQSQMTGQYQMQGLVVEESATRFVRFDFVRGNTGTRIFAASFTGTTPTVLRDITIPQGNPAWMRVKRTGNSFIQSYSYDGVNWTVLNPFTNVVLNVTKIGPFIGNAGYPEGTAPAFTGLIDYFFSTASPVVPEDGVTSPPFISQHPQNASVSVGQTATFTVIATGTTPLSYKWQKNAIDIPGATSASYTTPPTTGDDNNAQFQCIVSNTYGTVTSNAALLSVTQRVDEGLLVKYDFNENGGLTVNDVSGTGTPLNLTIPNASLVNWIPGALQVTSPTLIQSATAATKVLTGVQTTNEITVEAWLTPQNTTQKGPARIVTISGDPSNRNVTLGQGLWDAMPSALYNARLRTSATNSNGQPELSSADGSLTTTLTHVVYTRNAAGNAKLYINGTEAAAMNVTGNFANWNTAYRIGIANEFGASRPWLGTFHMMAIYNRALTAAQVALNHSAGPEGAPTPTPPQIVQEPQNRTATVGTTATFSVTATGTLPLGYQWQKNEVNIPGAESASYTTPPLALTDNGATFRCIVSNAHGTATSNAATLTVVEQPSGLLVRYDFNEGAGQTVNDVSGTGTPLNLTIPAGAPVNWGAGTLNVTGATLLQSAGAATKVINAVTASNEITIEAWVTPQNATQNGPARIVTISADPNNRNMTLGQGMWGTMPSVLYNARLRTSSTNSNGQPELATPNGSLTTSLTHVVYTRTSAGVAKLYLNGVESATMNVTGNLANWNATYKLGLANEFGLGRAWLGTFHRVMIFSRALSATEVATLHTNGPEAGGVTRPLGGDLAGMNPSDQPHIRLIPTEYTLDGNYPNPFNPMTTIRYGLPVETSLTLVIYDVMGQEVRRLIDGRQQEGYHEVLWDGRDNNGSAVSSGVYIYRLQSEKFTKAQRMVLMK